MDRNNQVTASSTPSEQGNIGTTFFFSPSAANVCIICHIDITVTPKKYPKIKIRDDGKILSPKLKFV